ncbi:hypothetical protein [Winogradskyella aquimaris]|uniref:Lipoprotein n=1 Tax=Winogradskyella aquimaris TaxID=864074 RepID=A0ABU5EPZ7_9FLAO|nr:hypothetical protein [Winogradskyella aquimaris]MDY2588199.1 hypothetical protein [Winogradskyella aquimaris]
MRKSLLLILTIVISFSCSTPLDKKYSDETFEADLKEIKEDGKLSEDDAMTLAGWIVRAKLKGENLEGKSYNEIIKEAKNYKKEQELLTEKAKLEEVEKRQRMGQVLIVALYDKGYEKYDYKDYLTYSFAFENKSNKDIRAFKGTISIQDLFNSEIKSISLTIDDPINAGSVFKGTYTTDYNQFRDEDVRLRNKDLEDIKVVWTPEKILFADGTSME